MAVTISMNEQPHSIPVDNCCGIIVAGATRPWGWTTWPVSPVGYSAGPEGEGGEAVSVFFAFNSPQGSLWKLLTSVRRRGIKDAVTYALGWVSDPAQYTESVDGFNGQWRTVTERWTA